MNVLSLFDGISCARVALSKGGWRVDNYYASEIDKYAIQISKKNWSDIMHVGDVKEFHPLNYDEFRNDNIDLLIGGSPCQDLSQANSKCKGLAGERSSLFYEYVRILKEVKPKYFLLENVASMSFESKCEISDALGVDWIEIDAGLVSAQNRKRLFWTNIPGVTQPKDKRIVLRDIVDLTIERKWQLPNNIIKTANGIKWDTSGKGYASQQDRANNLDNKHPTVPTSRTNTKCKFVADNGASVGMLTWEEIEKLQGLLVGYTDLGKDNRQEKRGACLGNAFNVDVVTHILSFMKF
jgi:site-specific DNA-cytosine methylase